MSRMDRRGFLVGMAGAASAVAGGAWWGQIPAAAASRALSARRAATFRALAKSLHDAPGGRFGVIGADVARRRFTDWYAYQDATVRSHADAVLDAIDEYPVPGYRRLAHGAAVCDGAASAPRSAAVAAAVDLVAVVCEPPPAEDEQPPAPPLELPA
jgi:hypothetical protein